jgi:hypothetical protein
VTELDEQDGRRAWLALLKADYRRLSADTRYDDEAASHYSWDSQVPNFRQIRVGDIIAIWDELELVGISVIESIEEGHGSKQIDRCRKCKKTNIERRLRRKPTYRCYNCEETFEEPIQDTVEVTTFRSNHSQGWTQMVGTLTAAELRSLCVKPKSQNSFRELRWNDFLSAAKTAGLGDPLTAVEATATQIRGGHSIRPVRVRLGQAGFRSQLLRSFGANCAFSGPLPEPVLDACHLYSYSKVGQHDPHGGILLRRDLHGLFDRGLIAVDHGGRIDVSPAIRKYPIYYDLHRKSFHIEPNHRQREWLQLHWAEFRS